MSQDKELECNACHIAPDPDGPKVMTACRLCGKLHCSDCVDEHGRCVACSEKEQGK